MTVVVALVGAVVVGYEALRPTARSCTPLSLVAMRQLARLHTFSDWLRRNRATGYVGEVGWPGTADWNAVAAAWQGAADADGLWVTAWSASRWWPANYPMAIYRLPAAPGAEGTSGSQATVLAAQGERDGALRGVDLPSGAFRTADDGGVAFSNVNPGRYGLDYYYEDTSGYRYLAARGVRAARLSVSWERLQPQLGGPLSSSELGHLEDSIRDAAGAGIAVIVDLHDFGGYWVSGPGGTSRRQALGSAELPIAAFADLWRRLAGALQDLPGVAGYDLMNEPGHLATSATRGAAVWEQASQGAVDAIRATGDRHVVAVEAYADSAPERFVEFHPHAWISDPAHALRYEAHQYFDADGSGHYAASFAAEERALAPSAPQRGATDCGSRGAAQNTTAPRPPA